MNNQTNQNQQQSQQYQQNQQNTKFCKFCGARIPIQAVICPHCGGQVEELKTQQQQNNGMPGNIVINNNNDNRNTNTMRGGHRSKECNKWVALILCIIFGVFGAHKFYEGKIGMGILYLFTAGLGLIGVFVDIIILIFKPVIYYT